MTGDSLLRRVVTRRLWPPQLCASTWHRRSLSSAPSKVSTHTQCLPQTRCWQLMISASHAAVYDRNARQKKQQQQAAVLLFITSNNLLQIIYALSLLCCQWVWWRCNPDRVKTGLTVCPLFVLVSPSQCVSWTCSQMETRWRTPTRTSRPAVSCWNWFSGRGSNVSISHNLQKINSMFFYLTKCMVWF